MRKTADQAKSLYPEAAQVLKDNSYMDYICDSVRSVQQAKRLTTELDEVLMKGGFQVKGWLSKRSLQNEIAEEEKPKMKLLQGTAQEKVLGTVWNHAEDVLLFNVNPPKDSTLTKRAILSQIARIFDPVGFAAAFLVRAKIDELVHGLRSYLSENHFVDRFQQQSVLRPRLHWRGRSPSVGLDQPQHEPLTSVPHLI